VRALLTASATLSAGAAGAREATEEPRALYAALQRRPDATLMVGGGRLDIVFEGGAAGVDQVPVLAWVHRSAIAVATYFGRFPVGQVGLLVAPQDGNRVCAVYIEPIARAVAGQLDDATVWRWSLRHMPSGLPGPGDSGLDHTHNHDRIYWGGAIFWLLAEVAIDQRSGGRRSLRTALRAINRASGGYVADWTAEAVMAAGDAATATGVLRELYIAMKDAPCKTDLPALFASLGIAEVGGRIVVDDTAPRRRFAAA
jgi:hypothetical protein